MKRAKNIRNTLYLLSIVAIIFIGIQNITLLTGINNNIQAPNFEVELIDGSHYQLTDSRGKYVILNFWGSWCPPCRKEIPELLNLYHKHKSKIDLVTIALEKNENRWPGVAEKHQFTWKHQIVEINRFVLQSELARKYGVSSIPAKFLITPKGELLTNLSFQEMDNILSSIK